MNIDEEGDDIIASTSHNFSDEQSQIVDDQARESLTILDRFLLEFEYTTKPIFDEIYRQILKIFSLDQ